MKWNQYLTSCSKEATDTDIAHLESVTGYTLPDDVKKLLKEHQGQIPEDCMIESDELVPVTFGPVLVANKSQSETSSYGIISTWKTWNSYHPGLLPIAESGGSGNVFALDFSNGSKPPKIVFIDHEADPADEDSVLFVANSIDELINRLEPQT